MLKLVSCVFAFHVTRFCGSAAKAASWRNIRRCAYGFSRKIGICARHSGLIHTFYPPHWQWFLQSRHVGSQLSVQGSGLDLNPNRHTSATNRGASPRRLEHFSELHKLRHRPVIPGPHCSSAGKCLGFLMSSFVGGPCCLCMLGRGYTALRSFACGFGRLALRKGKTNGIRTRLKYRGCP